MEEELYRHRPFSSESLIELFCIGSPSAETWEVARKPQISYLQKLCGDNGVRTLILEPEYVDRHFSDDYGGYYSKCYSLYKKKCARLHYFKSDFSKEDFVARLLHPGQLADLGYFGFTVIKPLPRTPVGRTCVQIEAPEGCAVMAASCPANLFGLKLSVQSVPFQEQDREVAACATSALWTALNASSRVFDHPVWSPLQITKRALASSPHHRASLPNNGLTIYQTAAVVRELGLEAEIIDLDSRYQPDLQSNFLLKSAVGAYLRLGIPLLLAFDFNHDLKKPRALHGVTVTGARWSGEVEPYEQFRLRSSRIDRVFVHDDGVGPYAPIELSGNQGELVTSWVDKSDGVRSQAWTCDLLVPLYHQIRIHFSEVLEAVMSFDGLAEGARTYLGLNAFEQLEWDIFLATGNSFKSEVGQLHLSDADKVHLLLNPLPHYLWRAQAYAGGAVKFELLFDATDLRQGDWLVDVVSYDEDFMNRFGRQLRHIRFAREFVLPMAWKVIVKVLRKAHQTDEPNAAL